MLSKIKCFVRAFFSYIVWARAYIVQRMFHKTLSFAELDTIYVVTSERLKE
jgi:hypothetical protein